MIEVAPQNAQLGDRVFNGSTKGVVAGVSNDNDCIMVLWTCASGVDVIGVSSPVWMHYDLLRDEPEMDVPGFKLPWGDVNGA